MPLSVQWIWLWIFPFAAIVCLILFRRYQHNTAAEYQQLLQESERVQATVVGFNEHEDSDTPTEKLYATRARFVFRGQTFEIATQTQARPPAHAIGQTLEVVVRIKNPEASIFSHETIDTLPALDWFGKILIGITVGITVIVAIAFVFIVTEKPS